MSFGNKLREFREENGLTQEAFAKELRIGMKTLYLYETGKRCPQTKEVYQRIADVMGCDYNYLLDEDEAFLAEVGKKYGGSERSKVQAFTKGISALFAGGGLSEEDRDAAFAAITEAYWKAKQVNKKYGRKKPEEEEKEKHDQ